MPATMHFHDAEVAIYFPRIFHEFSSSLKETGNDPSTILSRVINLISRFNTPACVLIFLSDPIAEWKRSFKNAAGLFR